jgi:hypothetical protein
MWVLADVGLAAGTDAGDPEQRFALACDRAITFLGVARWEGDQRQPDPASLRKSNRTHRPEHPVLENGFDDLGSKLGHQRFLLLESGDNLFGIEAGTAITTGRTQITLGRPLLRRAITGVPW